MNENKPFNLDYECGCVWEYVIIPYEHWRPNYCDKHQDEVIEKHDKWFVTKGGKCNV